MLKDLYNAFVKSSAPYFHNKYYSPNGNKGYNTAGVMKFARTITRKPKRYKKKRGKK